MLHMASEKSVDPQLVSTKRVSVTFPVEHYEELERIAQTNRVSLAWVVRHAVEQYLDGKTPLFDREP